MSKTKGLLFTAGIALATALTGCGATQVKIEMDMPPGLAAADINPACIKSIAVVPFDTTRYGNILASHATSLAREQIRAMENIALEDDPDKADITLSGEIKQTNAKVNASTSEKKDAKGNVVSVSTTYSIETSVELSYTIKTAKDGKTIGPIPRAGGWKASNLYSYPGSDYYLKAAISGIINMSKELFPYKKDEVRDFLEDYNGDKDIKKEMKKALALAKKSDYKPALEAYLGIYERHKSTAAALNAAIIHQHFGDLEPALEMARKAIDEAGNPVRWFVPNYIEYLNNIIKGRANMAVYEQEGCE